MQLPSKNDLFSVYQQVSSKVKQYAKNLTPLEVKVEDATNNEPWGPHGTVMAEITKASYDFENYKQIMGVIARRLQSEGESWRHVYKSLLLLEYMSKHGPQKVVSELSSNISTVEGLERFQYKDKNNKDWGLNVRQRAKELRNLVSNPELIRRERQKAKENASKYTGVSSEESRMSGFGSSSTSFGGSTSAMGGSAMGGSALSRVDIGGRSKGPSVTGFGNTDSYSDARYDDDLDSGHHALSTDDLDDSEQDSKQATRKRIEALKKAAPDSPGRKPRVGPFNKAVTTAEAEARGPKKLSQVKVDPSIAKSLGVPSRGQSPAPSTASAPSQTQDRGRVLDLFADSEPPAPAAPAAGDKTEATWGAFGGSKASQQPGQSQRPSDDWGSLLDGPGTQGATAASAADPFSTARDPEPPAAQPVDPFLSQPASSPSQAQDPFAMLSGGGSERKAGGALPLAPAPQKADADPFAILAADSPHASLAPKPQSPLKSSAPRSTKPSAGSFDPFTFSTAPASTGNSPSVAPSSRVSQALPEGMFTAPAPGMQSADNFRVNVGVPGQQNGAKSTSSPMAGFGQRQLPTGSPHKPPSASSQQGFGGFTSTSTEDMFGAMSFASPSASDKGAEALGGGVRMAPSMPQPNMPPPVTKQDPFAGLAGF